MLGHWNKAWALVFDSPPLIYQGHIGVDYACGPGYTLVSKESIGGLKLLRFLIVDFFI